MAKSPNETVTGWLSRLDTALKAANSKAAAALYAPESFWRDFLTFTWNLKTLEGRDEIAAMLDETLGSAGPSHWTLEGDASEADGITEGWIRFETTAARGEGHLRLNADGEAWTFLTAAYELKGYEEPKGSTREKGVEHGLSRGRKTWLAARHFRNKGNQEANDPPAPVYPRT